MEGDYNRHEFTHGYLTRALARALTLLPHLLLPLGEKGLANGIDMVEAFQSTHGGLLVRETSRVVT
jgi:hypothetical protein